MWRVPQKGLRKYSPMKDLDRLKARLREFGGWRLVWTYVRMRVLGTGMKALAGCLLRGESFKKAYPKIRQRVDCILLRRYGHLLSDIPVDGNAVGETLPKIIWTCWLQGEDKAPALVKACMQSQRVHLAGYEHRVLTLQNYSEWVTLPSDVTAKYERGIIPAASFSDLIRLAVLRDYGGVWLDATVFCTGMGNERLAARWQAIERSCLTLFRYYPKGSNTPAGLSTWFVAARKGSPLLRAVLDALLAYWHDHECLVDYYIIHLFIAKALEGSPALLAKMPRENSRHSLLLAGALHELYDEGRWQDLVDHVSFHKLNYRKQACPAIHDAPSIASGQPMTYLGKVFDILNHIQ